MSRSRTGRGRLRRVPAESRPRLGLAGPRASLPGVAGPDEGSIRWKLPLILSHLEGLLMRACWLGQIESLAQGPGPTPSRAPRRPCWVSASTERRVWHTSWLWEFSSRDSFAKRSLSLSAKCVSESPCPICQRCRGGRARFWWPTFRLHWRRACHTHCYKVTMGHRNLEICIECRLTNILD